MFRMVTAALAIGLATGLVVTGQSVAASKKKNVRASMTEEQKREARRKAREYCKKRYAVGTSYLESVRIREDGRIICYIRGN